MQEFLSFSVLGDTSYETSANHIAPYPHQVSVHLTQFQQSRHPRHLLSPRHHFDYYDFQPANQEASSSPPRIQLTGNTHYSVMGRRDAMRPRFQKTNSVTSKALA
ncbi:hypothetical protein TNIN_359471 [Trichonephila inaurata madagascariensis]|uniref:Uncharacterized protein n=1 Tax=Trichonephila inaurata madagascariensis TaxID=2747483 RepID=A0A8X6YSE3_9ARAC|nr:hypothetical protein TNIN_359471 [Trichonephila inaurata madagascariensis]